MSGSLTGAPMVWREREWLRRALLLWLFSCAIYALTAPGRLDLVDGAVRYEVADNWLNTGKPTVSSPTLFAVRGTGGQRYALYPWGHSLAGVPFVAMAQVLSGGSLGAKQFAFTLTSVPYAAAVIALLFLIYGRLGLTMRRAALWSLVTAFCSLLWPYAGSSFDQALQCFWLTLAVWSAVEAQSSDSVRWAGVSAIAFFMLISLQEVYVVLVVGLLLGAARLSLGGLLQAARKPSIFLPLLGALLAMLSGLLYNHMRFGTPLTSGRFNAPHPIFGNPLAGLSGLLLSPAKSIFLYSPTCVLGVLGLVQLARSHRAIGRVLIAVCLLQLGLISCLAFWAGEWAWGPRYLVATLGLVAIGVPFAIREQRLRSLKLGLAGAGLLVQLLAIGGDHQRYYFERGYPPYFWTNQAYFYQDSPLFARPSELAHVFSGEGIAKAKALVPSTEPFLMTSVILGMVDEPGARPGSWMEEYLVFQVPRPWTLWARLLPEKHRPAPTDLLTLVGVAVALVSLVAFTRAIRSGERRTDG